MLPSASHILLCTGLTYTPVAGEQKTRGEGWNGRVTSSTAHGDTNQTIQHLCPSKSLGPATSRASPWQTTMTPALPLLQLPTFQKGRPSMLDQKVLLLAKKPKMWSQGFPSSVRFCLPSQLWHCHQPLAPAQEMEKGCGSPTQSLGVSHCGGWAFGSQSTRNLPLGATSP